MAIQKTPAINPSDDLIGEFIQYLNTELEQSRKLLREVTMLVDQSQAEYTKLSQRNATTTAHLQQVQAQFDTLPRADIRTAYAQALDAQQRLLVMRGQLEKFQGDQQNLKKYVNLLERLLRFFSENVILPAGTIGGRGATANLEMLINAQEAERQRLSRQMHDGPAQALSNFIVQTEIVSRLFDIDPNRAKDELGALKTTAMKTFQKVRSFISELRPMMLDDLGLVPTIRRYVDMYKEQSGVDVTINIKGTDRRIEPYLEVFIFRAIQEMIGNSVTHNTDMPGKLQVSIQLVLEENSVRVSISDTGKGFDPDNVLKGQGLGLKLIKERVEMLGGDFDIDTAIGKGCRISFAVPCSEVQTKA